MYIRVTKFTSRVKTTSHTANSKMHQSYVPFSKLDVDAVFKILDKEKTIGQYGEKLVLYLEPSPNNQDFISDVIIKTNAPKSLKEKISADSEIDEFIVSKGKINGKKTIKTLYLKSDSISFQTGFPYVADFDIMEDDTVLAKKMDKALKVGHTYAVRDVFYFDTKYGESGIARLKDDETNETVSIYLPKSLKQDIKLTRKVNKKIYHEKIEYNGFKTADNKVKVYQYKYTYDI